MPARPGSQNWSAKLTEDQVRAIRDDGRSQRAVAKDYGVSGTLICHIRKRIWWKHI
jgi:hypothetical protein